MAAAVQYGYGDPSSAIRIEHSFPRPALAPDHLLVHVHASAVNRIDTAMMRGCRREELELDYPLPRILGRECAGEVVSTGSDVTDFSVGDRVFGMLDMFAPAGTHAHLAVLPENHAAHIPLSLPSLAAAALPFGGVVAHNALHHLRADVGRTVLVCGGAGNIGSLAVQLLKHSGCRVIATCKAQDVVQVCRLGADIVLDGQSDSLRWALSGERVDGVLNTVGDAVEEECLEVLSNGGHYVTTSFNYLQGTSTRSMFVRLFALRLKLLAQRNISYDFVLHLTHDGPREALTALAHMAEHNTLRALVDRVYPFEDILAAYEREESEERCGKVLLDHSAL